jgi:lysophospholipase L1-like esterase
VPKFRSASVLPAAAALLGLVLSATPAPGSAEGEPEGRRYVVAAIGDSLTDPRSGGGKYLRALAERCPGSRFDAYGVGGQRSDHMRWRFAHDVLGHGRARPAPRYSHVIVLAGINDLLGASIHHAPIARIQRNLSSMYQQARKHGIEVIAVTIPPWGRLAGVGDARARATDALNAWLLARPDSVEIVADIRPALGCGDPRSLCPRLRRHPNDLVHWNTDGHRAVADVLLRAAFSDCR